MSEIGKWIETLANPDICWWCGRRFDNFGHARQVHHIERRMWCGGREDYECNLFLVGKSCHDGPLAASGPELHAATLARKMKYDPDHYDLIEWLKLRDPELNAPHRVTLAEIVDEMEVKPW